MSMSPTNNSKQSVIMKEAREWYIRLHTHKISEAEQAEFTAWLNQSAEHRAIYHEIDRHWHDMRHLERLAARHYLAEHTPHRKRHWHIPALTGLAVAAGLLIYFNLSPKTPTRTLSPLTAPYQTAIGEQRNIYLRDRSIITLNTHSHLQVHYSDKERHIALTQGQAMFNVKQDQQRPFVVTAGGGNITALGTRFDVHYSDTRTTVTLFEGRVHIKTAHGEHTLKPAQRISYGNNGVFSNRLEIDAQRATAWLQGLLDVANTPLAEVIHEMNRYHTEKLILVDNALHSIRLSGVFRTDDLHAFVRLLELSQPVFTNSQDGYIYLHYRS